MKDLKFLLVTNNLNELSVSLCKNLNDIGFVRTLDAQENNTIINAVIRSKIDIVFLDVDFLSNHDAIRICNLIENITGKACVFIENNLEFSTKNSVFSLVNNKWACVDYNILKIDLLCLIIDSLNKFNNNKLLRKEKCYDFIYIVWEDLRIKKVQINSIKEILKCKKATYVFCNDRKVVKRIINISFEVLYKLLNKNFEKSRFKIVNKEWLNNSQKTDFFLRNSA